VKELATVSLTNPVKVFVNENKDIAFNLQQEFVRIRPHMEADREAIIAGQLATGIVVFLRNIYGAIVVVFLYNI